MVRPARLDDVASLLDAASAAVISIYRSDGTVLLSPVWYRWSKEAFEVVVAEGDVKLRHLALDRRVVLVIFETVPPFRGVELRGEVEILSDGVGEARRSISLRYLGNERGERFTAQRGERGVVLRLPPQDVRVWDLASILPPD